MRYRSIAVWPESANLCLGNTVNESDDTHATREQAEVICSMLRRHGFGGGGMIFPVSTRVEFADLPVGVVYDETATGRERYTYRPTGRAIVRQPFMTDEAWEAAFVHWARDIARGLKP